jgi:hypothetical protein
MTDLLLPWKSLKEIHDHFAATAVRICNSGREVSPQLLAMRVGSDGDETRVAPLPPKMVFGFFSDVGGKDALSNFLVGMLTEGHPVQASFEKTVGFAANLIVQITESWVTPADVTLAECDALESGTVAVSEIPNRAEAVLVSLHMRGLTIPVTSPIFEKPTRHATIGEFPAQAELLVYVGRLTMQDKFDAPGASH